MEEAKAAAYYDELNRKGEGARRFKQGLGFSSSSSDAAAFSSKPTAASFLSGFVRAGAAPAPAQLPHLSKQPPPHSRRPSSPRRRSSSPPLSPPRIRSRSRSPSRSSRRRSRSRSRSRERRRRSRSRDRDRRPSRRHSRSRGSRSPSRRSGRSSHSEGRWERHGDRRRRHDDGHQSSKGRGDRDGGKMDYSRLIEGYDKMTPAERVKAKMKLQLSETAAKDSNLGTATVGWERFQFNKDAPLDEDNDDIEVANDDASLVKNIGKSFRLSAVESKHEDIVRDAHDEAMFGVPTISFVDTETGGGELHTNHEDGKVEDIEADEPSSSLISDKVLAMQKGSWRDRAQKLRHS